MNVQCAATNVAQMFKYADNRDCNDAVVVDIGNDEANAVDLLVQHGADGSTPTPITVLLKAGRAKAFVVEAGDPPIHVKLASGNGPVTVKAIVSRFWRTE